MTGVVALAYIQDPSLCLSTLVPEKKHVPDDKYMCIKYVILFMYLPTTLFDRLMKKLEELLEVAQHMLSVVI